MGNIKKDSIAIMVDLDGVVANFSLAFSQVLRNIWGYHLPVVDNGAMIKAWDWDLWYPLNKAQIDVGWDRLQQINNFWLNDVGPVDHDYFKIINDLGAQRVDIYYVTTRLSTVGYSVAVQSAKWLGRYVTCPFVIQTSRKHDVVNALDIKYVVDDSAEKCFDILAKTDAVVCVYDYPYNRDLFKKLEQQAFKPYKSSRLHRISNLEEYKDIILKDPFFNDKES